MDGVENSQEQLAVEYENQKRKIKELMNEKKKLFCKNQHLSSNFNILTELLFSEKIKLNKLAQ